MTLGRTSAVMGGAWAAAALLSAACGTTDDRAPGDAPALETSTHGVSLSPGEITGLIRTQTGPEVNRCLWDPVNAVRSLRQRGDIMGFNGPAGGFGTGYPELSGHKWHWQGVQRLPPIYNTPFDFDRSQARHMIVSSSQKYFDKNQPNTTGGHFAVAYMGSRGNDGERWRGNRLGPDTPDWNHAPSGDDLLFQNHNVEHDNPPGSPPGPALDGQDYNHVSSNQVLGRYLFQPLERYSGSGDDTEVDCENDLTNGGHCQARVHVYDLSALSDPPVPSAAPIMKFATRTKSTGASAVAVARLAPLPNESRSRILMVVAGGTGGSRDLEFWLSGLADANDSVLNVVGTSPFQHVFTLDLHDGDYRQGWSDYQNINLVTACERAGGETSGGQLFLLGMTRDSGDDVVDIFELNVTLDGGKIEADILHDGKEGPVARRHMYCDEAGFSGENQCDFDAGAGAYVDPAGRLFIYATDWTPEGPDKSQQMMEFRPEDHLDDPATIPIEGCPNLADSWVELYDNRLFKADGSQPQGALPTFEIAAPNADDCCQGTAHGGFPSSRVGMMIDWPDRSLRSYEDYDRAYAWTPGNGATDAARWCIPLDIKYVAFFGTDFRGDQGVIELLGDGTLHGENFKNEEPLRSGCFMTAPTVVDTSGASNLASCL